MLATRLPKLTGVYIDCEASARICAQHGIFSLPSVKVYIDNMLIVEDANEFSLFGLMQRIERSYALWTESNAW